MEANAIGDWNKIGYTGPGASSAGGSETNVFSYIEGDAAPQWTATAKQKLNDCDKGSWTLSAAESDHNEEGHYDVAYTAGGDGTCTGLTPSFVQLTSGRNE